jgi:Cd2+/Zn2+-exporting ATPase
MDGRVVSGSSWVNQAPITGEGRLIEKGPGAHVFASSINGEGALEVEVTHLAADNTISRMVKLVEQAQERRAPAQRFVDQFARVYTPAVVLMAFAVALIPPVLFGQPFLDPGTGARGWLYRGLALLVVACPCALVISTPVSIISAISNAARHGVLIKGGVFLERLNSVRAVALDKTGTLTQGRPSVVAVRAAGCSADREERCEACDELVGLANAVEQHSEHPLARAVQREALRRAVDTKYGRAGDVQALPGHGVRGRVNGKEVTIGSHSYFDRHIQHPEAVCVQAREHAAMGLTPLMLALDGKFMGAITVADSLRASSRTTVEELRKLGLQAVVMLTGDTADVAQEVASQLELTQVHSDQMPQDKVAMLAALKRDFDHVAMVGDGVNDAPVLASADVGLALGGDAGGTAQAMETADITIMSSDLRRLPFVFRLSRATMRTIWANVALSLGVKLVFFVLVLTGVGTMWMAVLADMGTSLLVTLNGMRLLRRPRMRTAPD